MTMPTATTHAETHSQSQEFAADARHKDAPARSRKAPRKQRVISNSTTGDVAVISKGKVSRRTAKKMSAPAGGYLTDCENLSKMELRRRYTPEASSHRNMLAREKSHGALVHPDFRDFASFLRLVGPKPAISATIDRIDNGDPEYAPGKVRWADKRTQNNNKSDTLILYYSRTGDTYTVSRLAKLRRVSASTIRKRRQRGWTDDEIIEGKRHHDAGVQSNAPAKREGTLSLQAASGRERELAFARKAHYARSAKGKAFWEMALSYEQHRNLYPDVEEAFPAPLEVLNELLSGDHGWYIKPEDYERKFRKFWPEHRPHVNFDKLPRSQKELIADIDPVYVAEWEKKAERRREIADQL